MAYTKQNFADGQVLEAEHLNKMEQGISDVSKHFVVSGGDTLTWDGNTEGLVSAGGFAYKVSDAMPTMEHFANGCTVTWSHGHGLACTIGETIFDLSEDFPGAKGIMIAENVVITHEDNVDLTDAFGILLPEKGVYFMSMDGVYNASLTIPGYTGFTTEKIDPKVLPDALQFGKELKTVIPEMEVTAVEADGMYAVELDASAFTGNEPKAFITFDGTKYTCDSVDLGLGFPVYGNAGIMGGNDTGEPFLLAVLADMGMASFMTTDLEPHTLKIEADGVKKIDAVYAPYTVFYSGLDDDEYLYNDAARTEKTTYNELSKAIATGAPLYLSSADGRLILAAWASRTLGVGADGVGYMYGEVLIPTASSGVEKNKITLYYSRYVTAEYTA